MLACRLTLMTALLGLDICCVAIVCSTFRFAVLKFPFLALAVLTLNPSYSACAVGVDLCRTC